MKKNIIIISFLNNTVKYCLISCDWLTVKKVQSNLEKQIIVWKKKCILNVKSIKSTNNLHIKEIFYEITN